MHNPKLLEILEESRTGKRLGLNMLEHCIDEYPYGAVRNIVSTSPPGQILVVMPNLTSAHEMAHLIYLQGIMVDTLCDVCGLVDMDALGSFAMNRFHVLVADATPLMSLPSFLCINAVHCFVDLRESDFIALLSGMTYRLQRKYEETLFVQYKSLGRNHARIYHD